MLASLYSICLQYIVENNQELTTLENVPFKPFVQDIINGIFQSEKPFEKSTLSLIGKAHGQHLFKQVHPTFTCICLSQLCPIGSSVVALKFLSSNFPEIITQLDLSHTDIGDRHIPLLNGFKYLQILDLCNMELLSDVGISHLSAMNTTATNRLPFLKELYLADNDSITDKVLKYIGKMETLNYIDLTNTSVTEEVAIIYLKTLGFVQTSKRKAVDWPPLCLKLHRDIRNMLIDNGEFIKRCKTVQARQLGNGKTLCFEREYDKNNRNEIQKRKNSLSDRTDKKKRVNQSSTIDDYLTLIKNEFMND
jgi:hypothetical protein